MVLGIIGCAPFGGSIDGARLERIQQSPQYEDGGFFNVERRSPMNLTWDYLKEQLFGNQLRVPPSAIPVIEMNPEALLSRPAAGMRAMWIGHAGVLIEIDDHRVLIDPVFSKRASPFQFVGPRRFHSPPISLKDLKNIDAVMISHDHYDHLDMATVRHLASQGTQFFVPLGIGAHLEKWDVSKKQIKELDWWENGTIGGLTVTCTPNRHYSGRGLTDQKATLWSSWSVVGTEHRFFYSGDTGYSKLFKKIGKQFGPFDLTIIKIGAYGPGDGWIDIHMSPEDAMRVHLDVKGKTMLPVHWATFNLAIHDWDEPIKRALIAAQKHSINLVTPRVGEIITVGKPFESTSWWESIR